MSKRLRSQNDENDENEKKRKKLDKNLLDELTIAFSGLNINDTEKVDDSLEEITKGMGDLHIGPIKVVIMPFAHGGIIPSTKDEQKKIEGMDIKLITSTPGTCTLMKQDSYIKLLSTIAARVKFRDHTQNPNFDNQLLEYFNNFQNYTVSDTVFETSIYIPEINKYWHRLPSKQTQEGYIDILSDTYRMYNYNDKTPSTKIYGPIPESDPLWDVIQPIARLMGVNAGDYRESPFVIYMYIDQNGVFRGGITPNTYRGITLNQILYNTNESIKNELGKKVHYVFADPNCTYGDANLKFGGRLSKKHAKHSKKRIKTNKNKTNKNKTNKNKTNKKQKK